MGVKLTERTDHCLLLCLKVLEAFNYSKANIFHLRDTAVICFFLTSQAK